MIGLTFVPPTGNRNGAGIVGVAMARMSTAKPNGVTLVVYGWRESEPGTLTWVFPSLSAALRAVRALRNAVGWLILHGRQAFDGEVDVEALRRKGAVLRKGQSDRARPRKAQSRDDSTTRSRPTRRK